MPDSIAAQRGQRRAAVKSERRRDGDAEQQAPFRHDLEIVVVGRR